MHARHLIGIAGPSGAGKTTLARALVDALGPDVALFSLDSYYRDLSHLPPDSRHSYNFDTPEALDNQLLIRHLRDLSAGRPVEKPVCLFPEHVRAPCGEPLEPAAFVIVEGLFALYWEEARSLLATRVFIELDDDTCLARRVQRDTLERGRSRESVRSQYASTVRPMYQRHVEPTRRYAHLVVRGDGSLADAAAVVTARARRASS